jgi:hypothetical protein
VTASQCRQRHSRNAPDSIQVNRELDSNEIDESDLHSEKHDDPIISTFGGISIDSSDDHENGYDRFESIVIGIQIILT